MSSPVPLAHYDPDTSSWRTFAVSFPLDGVDCSDEFLATWPPHGMTRDGLSYELPTSAHHMAALGSSSLLRTPTAQLAINGGSQHPDKRKAGGHGPTLADEVEHLLPTPAVNDMGEGKTPEAWDEWTAKMQASHGNGNGHGKSLAIEAARLLPTPKSTNNENRQSLDRYGMNLGMAISEITEED